MAENTAMSEPKTVPTPLQVLRDMVTRAGTQKAVARDLHITPSRLCEVLNGRRDVSKSLADKLGYRRVKVFILKTEGR